MLWGGVWYRSRTISPAAMLKRLPTNDAVVVFIDFKQLRRRQILQLFENAKVGQDPEYQSFIQKIDFDYQHDLDTAMVAFSPAGKFMLLRGRFDWKALKDYVLGVGGHCNNTVCKLVGSTPDRHISFFPLQKDLMALAVSQDEGACERMNNVDSGSDRELPDAPIWMLIPPSVVRSGESLPAGTQMFAHRLDRAESVTLWMALEGEGLQARMDVRCANVSDAVDMASELTKVTNLLRRMIESENQTPNPADLSGFLTAGAFHNEGSKVVGAWPIQRALIENLLK